MSAQNINKNTCPGFTFERNLQKGSNGEDVLVLQKILNLDKRTMLSTKGVGSPGNETRIFGDQTRLAVKKFQALFIEKLKVADGKFNDRTRIIMNAVCQGSYFNGTGGAVFDLTVSPDKTRPTVNITGPSEVEAGETFRINVEASETIQTPDISVLILEGVSASQVRKLSSRIFSFLLTPTATNTTQLSVQVEADKILDLAGNKNEVASNLFIIEVIPASSTATTSTTTVDVSVYTDSALLNEIINSLPTATNVECSQKNIHVYDYSNACYGKALMVNPETNPNNTTPKVTQNILSPMITGLLTAYTIVKLTGGLGSLANILKNVGGTAVDSGGYGSFPGTCVCKESPFFGQKTIGLFKIGGLPYGRYIMTANPSPTGGPFVGKVVDKSDIICGRAEDPKTKKCLDPNLDSQGSQSVMGIIPAKPDFNWEIAI